MKVVQKQNNSKMCIICGMDNPLGVQAQFYEMEDKSLCGLFTFKEEHQSYPGRVHGGMISAMLDELACRAFWVYSPEILGVTISLQTKYRKPVPYGVPLKGIGRITRLTKKNFEAECFIKNQDNEVLAEGIIRYLILPGEKISDASYHEEMCYHIIDDIKEIEI